MNEATRILQAIERGESAATDELFPLVYDDLRRMAAQKLFREQPGQTLTPTALVHEAYLRLIGPLQNRCWVSHRHFFGAASEAMRRILINRARDKKRLKRGGGAVRKNFDLVAVAWATPNEELLALDEALEQLAAENGQLAELVKLRFFGGLTFVQAAQCLQISTRTAERDWAYARAWLLEKLRAEERPPDAASSVHPNP